MAKLNTYEFQGTRFIPGYNDFDVDDYEVEASSEKEAWELLDKYTKMFTWRRVGLMYINGIRVQNKDTISS